MTDAAPHAAKLALGESAGAEKLPTLVIEGRLDTAATTALWRHAHRLLKRWPGKAVILQAADVTYCDGAGAGLLLEMQRCQVASGGQLRIDDLAPEYKQFLDQFEVGGFERAHVHKTDPTPLAESVGERTVRLWGDIVTLISYVGELSAALGRAALRPRTVRWKDAALVAERAGADAIPIICLLGFLMGLIMSFQSAVLMREFGVEIFVANLVGLSMVRELGPLITAILLAGRSGSAFAAELGTMKINEELDALSTMGLDNVRFLVVPRVLAAVAVMPLLTIFASFSGIIGGAVVLMSFGYPLKAYVNQMLFAAGAVTLIDLAGGLVKAFALGILVAAIGCLRGLQTEAGASAVGVSTTRAVVSGIVLIALCDGVFAVAYYFLGI